MPYEALDFYDIDSLLSEEELMIEAKVFDLLTGIFFSCLLIIEVHR